MLFSKITDLIGNTPMLLVPEEVHGVPNLELWAKLEHLNPFGSLKDRTAWALLSADINRVRQLGQTILEVSSGNTGKSLQAISSLYGVDTRILSSLYKVREQKEILQLLGGELEEVDAASDCFDAEDPGDPYYLVKELVAQSPDKYFRAGQFDRQENAKIHYETTGKEIQRDLPKVDLLFIGVGSSGSSQGIKRALAETNPRISCVGVAGAKDDSIPGIMKVKELESAARASMLFDRSVYDEIIEVTEVDALENMLVLNRKVGLLVGPSTGASLAAIKKFYSNGEHPAEKLTAVFIACDRVEPYLSYVKQRLPKVFNDRSDELTITNYQLEGDIRELQLSANEFDKFSSQQGTVVIDVRSPKAFGLKPCRGAINIPLATFEKLIDSGTPFPKEMKILLVCAIGEQTVKHASFLRKKGYVAYSLEKGMRGMALAQSGFL